MTSKLRAVAEGEKAPRTRAKAPKTVAEAALGGNQRELLVAMRDRIAVAVAKPDCPPRDLASLTRRLQEIATELAGLDAQTSQPRNGRQSTKVDEGYDSEAI